MENLIFSQVEHRASTAFFNIIIMMAGDDDDTEKTLDEKERKKLNYANRALRRWPNEKRKLRSKMWVENGLDVGC